MTFRETPIEGAYEIELEAACDERGWFARSFDADEFERAGIALEVVHANASFNEREGTLRGMHYQSEPHAEPKLVRCTRGAIFDVVVDVRPGSATLHDWHGVELTPDNGIMLFVPAGLAHGFQTLADGSEVTYLMGHRYVPEAARGLRWDDPVLSIDWPEPAGERIISEADSSHPLVSA